MDSTTKTILMNLITACGILAMRGTIPQSELLKARQAVEAARARIDTVEPTDVTS